MEMEKQNKIKVLGFWILLIMLVIYIKNQANHLEAYNKTYDDGYEDGYEDGLKRGCKDCCDRSEDYCWRYETMRGKW